VSEPIHVSSLIVHVQPDQLEALKEWLEGHAEIEIRGTDPAGKIVAVMETIGEQPILDVIEKTEAQPGTLNANLVYHEIISAEEADQLEEVQS